MRTGAVRPFFISMPYKIVSNHSSCPDSKSFAVVKQSDGKKIGCHSSREGAKRQLAALHANESDMKDKETKDIRYLAVDFAKRVLGRIKGDDVKEENKSAPENRMMIWKEAGEYRWLARYSNNFRDEDYPPEIISGESHKNFVKMVEVGEVPLPDLWLWHVPEWKVGKADWVAYDETDDGIVFALAGGSFDKEAEWVAKQLSKVNKIGVSHGMPHEHTVRDPEDPTIIVQHSSAEISPLIPEAAANKIADFAIFNKEVEMAIPNEKRQKLTAPLEEGGWNLDTELLSGLEKLNSQTAKEHAEEVEHKETTDETTDSQTEEIAVAETDAQPESQSDVAEEVVEETTEEAVEEDVKQAEPEEAPVSLETAVTAKDVAEALSMVTDKLVKEAIQPLAEQVSTLSEKIAAMEADETEKVAEKAQEIPTQSMAHFIAQSVIGNPDALIDGRSSLAKSKPEEAEAPTEQLTGIPFLDETIFGGK